MDCLLYAQVVVNLCYQGLHLIQVILLVTLNRTNMSDTNEQTKEENISPSVDNPVSPTSPKQFINEQVNNISHSEKYDQIQCIDSCPLGGREVGKSVKCDSCYHWFHLQCLNVKNFKDLPKAWKCLTCRLMPSQVKHIMIKVTAMEGLILKQSDLLNSLINSQRDLTTTNSNLTSELQTNNKAMIDANQTIKDLQTQVLECQQKIKSLEKIDTPQSSVGPNIQRQQTTTPTASSLLIESSLLRDMATTNNHELQIRSTGGATTQVITSQLKDYPDSKFTNFTVLVGGNDCDNNRTSVEDIMSNFRLLLTEAKRVTTNDVFVSSIPTRNKGLITDQKIVEVNSNLKSLSDEFNCNFIDNDKNFRLRDGAFRLRDGAFRLRDGKEAL